MFDEDADPRRLRAPEKPCRLVMVTVEFVELPVSTSAEVTVEISKAAGGVIVKDRSVKFITPPLEPVTLSE